MPENSELIKIDRLLVLSTGSFGILLALQEGTSKFAEVNLVEAYPKKKRGGGQGDNQDDR